MAIRERKQITGTAAQIKGFAGHNGVLAYATDTKHLHVLSGTAGTTTELANRTDIPDITGKADTTYVNAELAGKADSSHTHTIANVTGLHVDLTAIRESITNVSSKVDGIGDTLSPTYAKKQGILDACDQAMNGANPVHAGDPALDEIKSALATIQAQLGQLESRRYVKETGKSSDGTSWYRVWSDGWIEQGGTYTSSDNNKYPVTLSKKMTTTNYHSTVTGGYNATSNYGFGYCYDKTTSGFKAGVIGPRGTWYVCGY